MQMIHPYQIISPSQCLLCITSQITSLTIVYSTVYSDADQGKHQDLHHWPLCGEFTSEIPAQMASNAENVSIL